MSPRSQIRFVAAGVVCIGLGAGWYFSRESGGKAMVSDGKEHRFHRPTKIAGEPEVAETFTTEERTRTFSVATDEVCIKGENGVETIARLDPPATPGTLRSRIAAFSAQGDVFPIAYPEGQPRDESSRRLITRQIRVKIPAGLEERVAATNGLTVFERPGYAPDWVTLEAADPLAALAVVDAVRTSKDVASADVITGRKRFSRQMPNDTLINNQWHLSNATTSPSITHINVETVWAYPTVGAGMRGRGIRIGIVDDGLETDHPDLADNVDTAIDRDWNGPASSPLYAGDNDPNPVANGFPANNSYGDYHGTAVAGLAGAVGNNNAGVSGVAPECKLVGLRLTGGSADPTDPQEAGSMDHRNDIIQVKNNSWGPADRPYNLQAPEPYMKTALANAVANGRGGKGTIIVWAGGNGKTFGDNSNYDGYANSIQTIAVGAININGGSSSYSEPGANLLLVAPSGEGATRLVTTDRSDTGSPTNYKGRYSGDYNMAFSGTSAATPVVSGVVALMLEKNPNLGWRDVQEILIRSATKVSPSDAGWHTNGAGFSFNHQFGAGLVNAAAAVNLANGWTNRPVQTSLASTDGGTVAIPENNATGVAKTFVFNENGHRVEHVTVSANISHTFRGNLKITLTSPSGMESVLADVFPYDSDHPAINYNWTFSTVHHWGESASGTWTVKVADRSGSQNTTGGALNAVTVTLFGSAHTFPPGVTSAALDRSGLSFADESLQVVSVSATDPQGGTPSLAYQWQSSSDGVNFTNASGENAEALSISPGHAGKLWRCAITPSNGSTSGSAFLTSSINLVTRPPAFVKTGAAFSYNPGLVLANQGNPSSFRLGTGSGTINGLTIHTGTGTYSGTVATSTARGIRNLIIERYDSQGNVVGLPFTLKVVPGSYAQWAGDHPLVKSEAPVDNDDDGIPNLIEYMLDLDANEPDTPSPVIFGQEGNVLTLTYRESKIPSDATLGPEWATALGADAGWQSTGIVITVLGENEWSRLKKASLAISPGDPKRFLRLKATQVPP